MHNIKHQINRTSQPLLSYDNILNSRTNTSTYVRPNYFIMFISKISKKVGIALAMLTLLLTVQSLHAQMDYQTLIKNRKAAFYRDGQYQSLRLDLQNTQDPILVTYQTYSTDEYPEVDIDGLLQGVFTSSKIANVETKISSAIKSMGSYASTCSLTDFTGIQELKTSQPISTIYKSLDGSAGAMLVQPAEATLFVALQSEPNTQMVINVVQLKDVSAADLEWNENKIQGIYTDCMKTATEDYDSEVCDCIKYYVPQQESYMKYAHLTPQIKRELINEYYNRCVREYNKTQVAKSSSQIEREVDALLKVGEQQWRNGEYPAFQKTYTQILQKGRIDDGVYTKLAESYFIMKNYEEFKKNTYLAVGTNKYNLFAQGKLIRILLLEGNYDKAVAIYKEHKGNRLPNNMTFRKYMKEDIAFTISNGYVNDNVKKFNKEILKN